jgi:hypothetical protein
MSILHNEHVDFEQRLGQVDPRRFVHYALQGTKMRKIKAI